MKKSSSIAGIVFFLLVSSLYVWFHAMHVSYRVEVIRSSNGYGYQLYEGKRTIIVQPFIPAIPGKAAFRTREEALLTGTLVMERIKAGDSFSISKTDLNSLKITY